MATVFFKGKQWVAQWYQPGGKRVKRGTGFAGGRREAERLAAEMEAKDRKEGDGSGRKFEAILARATADAKAGKLSLGRAEEYLAEIRQVADPSFRVVSLADHLAEWCAAAGQRVEASTARGFGEMRRHFLAVLPPAVAAAPVGELTRAQVESALRRIVGLKCRNTGRNLRAATANLDLRALRRALAVAVNDGLARVNVASQVRTLPETDSVERAPFTAAEVRQLMDAKTTSAEWRGAILLGGHTGLRLGDVVSLGRGHVVGSKLVIRPTKTKGAKKTVTVPLTPPCLAWIGERTGDFFPSLKDRSRASLSTHFARLMTRAGVAREIELPGGIKARRSFHSLRHSFASWLAEGDIHADIRQKLTGHSSAGVHAKYTHHDEALDRAIKVLPDFGTTPANPPRKSRRKM